MRNSIFLFTVLMLVSCKKDPDVLFPKSYTFDHVEQSDEGHYRVENADDITALSTAIGSFGAIKADLKMEILEGIEIAFDIQEIEVLSEDSLRIDVFIEEFGFEIMTGYTRVDGEIVLDSLASAFLTHEKEDDQFVLCSSTVFALAGPNVNNPGQGYYQFDSAECLIGFSNEDYAIKLLGEFAYQPLDTIGVILTKVIYK